ncbi:hypothetical protein GCM10017556_08440 [Micromonospora sagamiensis]|nr:hypothetical protein GCM10017556_08440 [Micromonospora sagamiensis]
MARRSRRPPHPGTARRRGAPANPGTVARDYDTATGTRGSIVSTASGSAKVRAQLPRPVASTGTGSTTLTGAGW